MRADREEEEEVAPFETIRQLIGDELATRLSLAFGGRRLYVPRQPGPHHPIAVAIGLAAALVIAREFGSARLDIPVTAGKRARIKTLLASKVSISEIARALHCTERHVYYVQAELQRGQRPPDLFD